MKDSLLSLSSIEEVQMALVKLFPSYTVSASAIDRQLSSLSFFFVRKRNQCKRSYKTYLPL